MEYDMKTWGIDVKSQWLKIKVMESAYATDFLNGAISVNF